jgi:hypothetical protein
MPGTQRSAMPVISRPEPSIADHDAPMARVIHAAERQARRARRAETARQRQRAALLDLLVKTMAELHISMSELNAARRALGGSKSK